MGPWPDLLCDRVSCALLGPCAGHCGAIFVSRPLPPFEATGEGAAAAGAPAPFPLPPTNLMSNSQHDPVNHPAHYTGHPSGVECIDITEHMNFCLGNAIKYVWRAGLKSNSPVEDLRKARWYIDREIQRLTRG